MSMGGGSTSQQALVQSINPDAYIQAGQLQSQAALEASQVSQQETNQALSQLTNQYNTAQIGLQPYTQSGIGALDQMNWLLGLGQYTPTAPTAPVMPTAANTITQANIDQYIQANTGIYPGGSPNAASNPSGSSGGGAIYGGVGSPGYSTNTANSQTPGFFDTFGVPNESAFIQQVDPSITSAVQNYLFQQQSPSLMQNYNSQQAAYQTQLDNYNYSNQLASQYQAQGPATQSDISNIITNMPGFQFSQQQGIQAIQNAASATGMLNSGNLLQGLETFGQGLSQQYFQQYLGNLASEAGMGANAASSAAGASQNLGNQQAGLTTNLGDTMANSILSAGQAQANALLGAGQSISSYNVGGGSSGGLGSSIFGGLMSVAGLGSNTVGGSFLSSIGL